MSHKAKRLRRRNVKLGRTVDAYLKEAADLRGQLAGSRQEVERLKWELKLWRPHIDVYREYKDPSMVSVTHRVDSRVVSLARDPEAIYELVAKQIARHLRDYFRGPRL